MNTASNSGNDTRTGRVSPNDLTSHRPSNQSGFWWLLVVGFIAAMLCVPFIRSVYWLGDEGILLNGATRLLKGSRLYVDFFEAFPPGGFVLTAVWFDMVGTSMLSARVLAILCIVLIACFIYLTCWQVSKHILTSIFLAVAWVVMSQGFWTQVSHHYFTTLFSLVAFSAAIASVQLTQRWQPWSLIAGVAAGAAAMVTPTRGALAMLAAATAFVHFPLNRAKSVAFILGCALVPTCLLAYVIWHGALVAAFDDVILFMAKHYVSVNKVPFGRGGSTQNLPLKYLFPLAALLTLLTFARNWRAYLGDHLFRLSIAFGLAGFIGCFPRPDLAHIGFAAPLGCPLVAYCVSQLTRPWLPKYRYAAAAIAIGLCIPSVHSFSSESRKALFGEIVATPRGDVTFVSATNEWREIVGRIAATPSADAYFFYPYMPMLSFLTARQNVSRYELFIPGFTLPIQYQEACVSAVRHASWLVIDRTWTDRNFLKMIFPEMQDFEPAKRFEQALASAFELVVREGSFEMRRRVEAIDDSVCHGIAE